MEDRRLESTGDPGHSEDAPRAWIPTSMPDDAQALGLDRNTEEGAWVSFAAGLDGAKRLHRLTAWGLLMVIVGIPVLLRLLAWLHYE